METLIEMEKVVIEDYCSPPLTWHIWLHTKVSIIQILYYA